MSTRVPLHLNSGEIAVLNDAVPEHCGQQDFFRALLLLASEDEKLMQRVQQKCGRKIAPHPDDAPGFQKGLELEQYREAIEREGSLNGAANALGVDRSTVREVAVRHEIPVESIGGVPD